MPSAGESLMAAPTAKRTGHRRIASTTSTARIRWTFRNHSSVATGTKAIRARNGNGRLPASHHAQPSRSASQAQLKTSDGRIALTGATSWATTGGYQKANGVFEL